MFFLCVGGDTHTHTRFAWSLLLRVLCVYMCVWMASHTENHKPNRTQPPRRQDEDDEDDDDDDDDEAVPDKLKMYKIAGGDEDRYGLHSSYVR